ncbi:uncharacterized protein LOC110396116 [Numida meleagris]|uniref:uncharacterized protein LOC110396116 n=1 Tax=Numida meleagris TaxID=8996 RepID=UPI000B3DF88F|nr:uncharacterized protein LOC110396116 [Numida meleagris]
MDLKILGELWVPISNQDRKGNCKSQGLRPQTARNKNSPRKEQMESLTRKTVHQTQMPVVYLYLSWVPCHAPCSCTWPAPAPSKQLRTSKLRGKKMLWYLPCKKTKTKREESGNEEGFSQSCRCTCRVLRSEQPCGADAEAAAEGLRGGAAEGSGCCTPFFPPCFPMPSPCNALLFCCYCHLSLKKHFSNTLDQTAYSPCL